MSVFEPQHGYENTFIKSLVSLRQLLQGRQGISNSTRHIAMTACPLLNRWHPDFDLAHPKLTRMHPAA